MTRCGSCPGSMRALIQPLASAVAKIRDFSATAAVPQDDAMTSTITPSINEQARIQSKCLSFGRLDKLVEEPECKGSYLDFLRQPCSCPDIPLRHFILMLKRVELLPAPCLVSCSRSTRAVLSSLMIVYHPGEVLVTEDGDAAAGRLVVELAMVLVSRSSNSVCYGVQRQFIAVVTQSPNGSRCINLVQCFACPSV